MTREQSGQREPATALLSAGATAPIRLSGPVVDAGGYAHNSRSSSTDRAYKSDWADFTAWCTGRNVQAVPASPATVAAYLADLASPTTQGGRGRRASTLRRRLAAISQTHQSVGHESPASDPLVCRVMAGIVREQAIAPGRKLPIRVHHLGLIVGRIPSNPIGVRDKALLLVGFAGAFRRSELVAIDRGDLQFVRGGVKVLVPTPRAGEGETIGIPYGSMLKPVQFVRCARGSNCSRTMAVRCSAHSIDGATFARRA
jgi:hypothetical protein